MRRDKQHILRKVLRVDIQEKRDRTTENKIERRPENYWTEIGRGDGQSDMEQEDHCGTVSGVICPH